MKFEDIVFGSTISGIDENGKLCMRQKPKNVEEAIYYANVCYTQIPVCRLYLEEAGRLAKLTNHPAFNELERILSIDKKEIKKIAQELETLASLYIKE